MADEPPGRLLLVEGIDDEHVVRRLLDRHQHMPNFEISDKKGFPNLRDSIGPELKVPGRTALGILVDANDDFNARWDSIRHQLRGAAINLPPPPTPQAGTVVDGTPRVGVWLMPDNRSTGELENFIERLMPPGDPIWPSAGRYIDAIPADQRQFANGKILRAKIHAWLATRAEPRKMGAAIRAGDLNATDPLATQFVDWLRRLFG